LNIQAVRLSATLRPKIRYRNETFHDWKKLNWLIRHKNAPHY